MKKNQPKNRGILPHSVSDMISERLQELEVSLNEKALDLMVKGFESNGYHLDAFYYRIQKLRQNIRHRDRFAADPELALEFFLTLPRTLDNSQWFSLLPPQVQAVIEVIQS